MDAGHRAVLRDELGARGTRVPTRELPDVVARIAARFVPQLRSLAPELGRRNELDTRKARARARRGLAPRPAAVSHAVNFLRGPRTTVFSNGAAGRRNGDDDMPNGNSGWAWRKTVAALCGLLAACGRSSSSTGGAAALPAASQCVLKSAALAVGSDSSLVVDGVTYTTSHQPDATGPLETPLKNVSPQPAGDCRGNEGYRFGSGLYDVTGPIGGAPAGHADLAGMVLPPQPQNGIHTRLYARAFAIERRATASA
ncbi:MAG: hypothetical protein QM661_13495 [Solimonas sp.]